MPITLTTQITTECGFSEWSIHKNSRATLVKILAYLYLRQERNAERVIEGLEPNLRIPKGRVAENVIAKLMGAHPDDLTLSKTGNKEEKAGALNRIKVAILHRDGLLFQHISWIVARKQLPTGVMTAPHVRPADKGFDGFIIELADDGDNVERIILCEDKASGNPRPIISSKVWPDISAILNGDRDDEILADLVTLLAGLPDIDAETAVDDLVWEEAREFRVAIATDEGRRKGGSFVHLIEGFENIAGGQIETRAAGVLPFKNLRPELEDLALEVIAKVKEIAGV